MLHPDMGEALGLGVGGLSFLCRLRLNPEPTTAGNMSGPPKLALQTWWKEGMSSTSGKGLLPTLQQCRSSPPRSSNATPANSKFTPCRHCTYSGCDGRADLHGGRVE